MKPSTAIILLAALAGQSVAAPTSNAALQAQQDTNALRLLATHLSTGELTQSDRVLLSHLLVAASSLRKRGVDSEDAADAADGIFSTLGGGIGGGLGAGLGGILDGASDLATLLLTGLLGPVSSLPLQSVSLPGGSTTLPANISLPANITSLPANITSTVGNLGNASGTSGSILDLGSLNDAVNSIFRSLIGGLDDNVLRRLVSIITDANGDTQKATDDILHFAATHGYNGDAIFTALKNILSLGNLDTDLGGLLKGSGGLLGDLVNAVNSLTTKGGVSAINNNPSGINLGASAPPTGVLNGLNTTVANLPAQVLNGLNTTLGSLPGGIVNTTAGNVTNGANGGVNLPNGLTVQEIAHLIDFIRGATSQLAVTNEVQRIANLHKLDPVGLARLLQRLLSLLSTGAAAPTNNTGIVPTHLLNGTTGGLPGVLNGTIGGLTGGIPGILNGTLGNLTGTLGGVGGLGGGSNLLGTLAYDAAGLVSYLLHLLGLGNLTSVGGLGGITGLLSGNPVTNLTRSLTPVVSNLTGTVGSIAGGLPGVIGGATNVVGSTLGSVAPILNSTLNGVVHSLGSTVESVVSGLNSTVSGLVPNLTSTVGSVLNGDLGSAANGVASTVGSAVSGLNSTLSGVGSLASGLGSGSGAGSPVAGLGSTLSGVASTATGLGSGLLNATGLGSTVAGLTGNTGTGTLGLGIGLKSVEFSDANDDNNTALIFDPSGSDEDEGSPRSNVRRSHAARFRASVRAANAA
ncbi:hypothetical protein GGI43DRAFT_241463 [Trichoderma evansii]